MRTGTVVRSALGLAALALASAEAAAQVPQPTHADLVFATVTDGQGQPLDLKLDLYLPDPPPATPVPCIVWIHGGAWMAGSKVPAPGELTEDGYAVASIEHRLSSDAVWPAQIHDCKGAVRWLRANASTYGLDPDRFGAFGPSSGGHLAAFLATSGDVGSVRVGSETVELEGTVGGNLGESSRIQAAVDWFGPTDFLRMDLFPSNIVHDSPLSPESLLIGAAIPLAPEPTLSADPARLLSADDPPTLVVHGTADLTVPFDQSEHLWRAASEVVGLAWDLRPVPDGGHGGPGFLIEDARDWFDAHLAARSATLHLEALGAATEGGAGATLVVHRAGSTAQALAVGLHAAGDARPAADYAPLPRRVVLPAGATSVALPVQALQDALVEGAEELVVALVPSPAHAIDAARTSATIAILDDEPTAGLPVVALLQPDRVAAEGAADDALVRFARTGPTGAPLTVAFRVGGTATPGLDHDLVSGAATIPAGAASVDVPLAALDDVLAESTELWVVELLPGTDYARDAQRTASGRLDDDDAGALPAVSVITEQPLAAEGGADPVFLVTRTGPALGGLTVGLEVGGTATSGADVAPPPASATFLPGERFRRVTLAVLDDALQEGTESVVLGAAPGAGYVVTRASERQALLADDEAVLPPVAPAALSLSSARVGVPLVGTVSGTPGGPFVVLLGLAPWYLPLPGYPFLLHPALLIPAGSGVLDGAGLGTFALVVPDDPTLDGVELHLQPLVVAGSSLELGDAPRRRIAYPD